MIAPCARRFSVVAVVLIATMLLLPLAPAFGLTDCGCDESLCVHQHGAAGARHGARAQPAAHHVEAGSGPIASGHDQHGAHAGPRGRHTTEARTATNSHCAASAKPSPGSTVRGCSGLDDDALPSLGIGALPRAASIAAPTSDSAVQSLLVSLPLDGSPSIDTPPPDASVT